jgi:hypothetical protein
MPEVPEGVVAGGWSYAIAAYSITALVLVAYAWSLVSRLRKASREEEPS